ncbi:DNA polymerase III subunit gamma/tau [Moraxella lacunata]|nr:DNA polymerase III subunit gamma/tau [Moraxella lacunata]
MSEYQVLARKYRPKNFSELLGQTHVSQALSHAIDTGRLHHAYLFTGTRGVGKTTIARILAKCLNCETGITSTPCGVCDTCVSVDNGRFIDLIEIDAASRTKVEDTRDLLENVPYAPTQGRYKVYLIDEVHMLSTHSFNALLKTLEEPPEHVKFILATTDPQKLPITIVSRCLQFVLRPMSQALLHAHLAKILHAESIAHDDTALWQLAQSAKGSVRDALSLTDQAIAFGGGQVGADTVMEMLGLVDSLDVLDLVRDIYHDDRSGVARHIARMREQMVDATALLDRLVDSFHAMALVQILPDMPLDMNDEQKQAFYELARTLPADVIQLYYEISVKARDSVRLASTPMQALEMGILRLLAFRPLAGDEVVYQEPKAILNQQIDNPINQSLNDESLNDESLNDESLNDESLNDESLAISQNTEIVENYHQEIGNQEIGNQEIGNQEIGNQEIGNQEIGQAVNNSQSTNDIKPSGQITKEQLKNELMPQQVALAGEWTPEKWDYWVAVARREHKLDADELAMVSHAMMVGQIDGDCQLYVPEHNKQIFSSFKSFAKKFGQDFANGRLRDETLLLSQSEFAHLATPVQKQKQRDEQVLVIASNQLLNSPVLQSLYQDNFINDDNAITSVRLTLNE